MSVLHAMTVDVEDWFQVLNMAHVIDRADWDKLELRCLDSTKALLDLLQRHDRKATFFFLGWIAERLPALVQEVHAAGHEIGSHGYDHRLLHELGQQGFAADLRKTNRILFDIVGSNPVAFRACTWSISKRTPWAVDELLAEGFTLDSSIQPVRHPDYGVPAASSTPYRVQSQAGELLEVSPLTLDVLGRKLPVGGGGYLRLLPLWLLRRALAQKERLGMPGCLYIHPWELDPAQPRQALGGLRGWRHYVNLARTADKLAALLADYRFDGLGAAVASRGANWRAKLPAFAASELLG